MKYPLKLKFHIGTLSNDFSIRDAEDVNLAYVRQQMLKLKEKVDVYSDETRQELQYQIRANRWLDFTASYQFFDRNDNAFGRVVRKGWKSIWKAHYEIYNHHDQQDFLISEDNPWVKVWDSLFAEIPILSFFTGYMFNPKYNITRPDGTCVAQLVKEKSFFGRHFSIQKLGEFTSEEEKCIIMSLMMMILMERRRG